MTVHAAEVSWEGGKDDLRAHTVRAGGQTIGGSCSPEWGGDEAKADPEALFVASLSACHMLWFLDLARRETAASRPGAPNRSRASATVAGRRPTSSVIWRAFAIRSPFERAISPSGR